MSLWLPQGERWKGRTSEAAEEPVTLMGKDGAVACCRLFISCPALQSGGACTCGPFVPPSWKLTGFINFQDALPSAQGRRLFCIHAKRKPKRPTFTQLPTPATSLPRGRPMHTQLPSFLKGAPEQRGSLGSGGCGWVCEYVTSRWQKEAFHCLTCQRSPPKTF